jgi:hypothetical protein
VVAGGIVCFVDHDTLCRLRGKTMDQEVIEMMSTLPADQQIGLASAFRDVTDMFASGIERMLAEHEPGYVIQKEDVEKMVDNLKLKHKKGDM